MPIKFDIKTNDFGGSMRRIFLLFLLLMLFTQAIWSADIEAQLDSDDGSSKFTVQDSGSNPVLSIDSDGNVMFNLSSWIGISGGGIIEFIDAATDTINFLNSFVGIGLSNPNERLTVDGVLSLKEQGGAPGNIADFGKVYVKSSDNKLYFLDDLGVEHDLTDSGGSASNLDDAYDGGRNITVDAGALQLQGTNAADETLEITNSADGGTLLVENTGTGLSLRINDSAGDASPFVVDTDGKVGIGKTAPTEMLDLLDGSNNGAIRIGNTAGTNAGTIRWNGTNFQGYDGGAWKNLDVSGGSIDHGSIGGLGDDDHGQYHNDARGDARYRTQTILSSNNNTEGASLIGIEDAGTIITATNVEGALTETKGIADTNSTNIGTNTTAITGKLNKSGDTMTGDLTMNAGKNLILSDDDTSNTVTLNVPGDVTGTYTLTFPPTDGVLNQILKRDGSGNLVWANDDGGTSYTADGDGILLSGSEFQLELDGTTLGKSASGLKVNEANLDHGTIGGLGDDDHAQYHNNTRGDARYRTQTILSSNNNAEGASIIGIEDAGTIIIATNVEGALSEVTGKADTNATNIGTNSTAITGKVSKSGDSMSGNLTMGSGNDLILTDGDTNTTTIQSAADVTANYTLTLPPADGALNQILKRDGSGNLVWSADNGGTAYTADGDGILLSGSEFQLELDGTTLGKSASGLKVNEANLDHGTLAGLTDDDHTDYHNNTRGDARYFQKTEHMNASAGVGDAGKPLKLDAAGHVDATMINDADISHGNLSNLGVDDHAQYHNNTRGDGRYRTQTILSSTSNAEGASLIGIEDAGTIITATNVEGALAEITGKANTNATNIGTNSTAITGKVSKSGDSMSGDLTMTSGKNLILSDDNNSNTVTLNVPADVTGTYTLTLPPLDGGLNQILKRDGSGNMVWANDDGGTSYTADGDGILLSGSEFQLELDGTTLGKSASGIKVNEASLDHGTIGGLGDDDHAQYHNNTRGDARYYQKTEHLNASAGAGDAGKPVKLDAAGHVDATMINDADVDHGTIAGLGDDDHAQYHNNTRGDTRYRTQTILSSTNNAEGASLIGIEDAGTIITATNVEGALAEITGKANTNATNIGTNSTAITGKVAKTGDSMSGDLTMTSGKNLILSDDNNSNTVTLNVPADVTGTYTLTLPPLDGAANQILKRNASGNLEWTNPASAPVDSVHGRTGAVVAANNDYTWAQINKTTSSIADITTRSAGDLSSGTLLPARLPLGGAWTLTSNLNVDSNTLVIDQSNNRVGVGINAPQDAIHVVGGVRSSNSTSTNYVTYKVRDTNGFPRVQYMIGDGDESYNNGAFWVSPAGTNQISTSLEALTNSDTSTNNTKRAGIKVNTTGAVVYSARGLGADGDTGLTLTSQGVDGTAAIFIKGNATQNVGIGNNSPDQKLHVNGTIQTGANGTDGSIKIYADQATDRMVTINPHAAMTQNVTLTLPPDDGTSNQVLETDGSGALSWTTISGTIADGTVTDSTLRWSGSNWVQNANLKVQSDGDMSVEAGMSVKGNVFLGDASTDYLKLNLSKIQTPNGLNFDANTLVIDQSNNRVGIGIANPASELDIKGTIKFLADATPQIIMSSNAQIQGGTLNLMADTTVQVTAPTSFVSSAGVNYFAKRLGIGQTNPLAQLEVEVADAGNVPCILVDNNDITNDTAGIQIDMAETGGTPLLISPLSASPNSPAKGSIYYDSDDDKLYLYNGAWTDLSSASTTDHGALGGLTDDDHTQYHNDTRGDARYFQETEHLAASAGAGSAGKPIKLDAAGHIDATMINDADIDHGSIGGLTDDDHSQYLLMAGRAGGQVLTGGTAASDKLVLESTSHATKGAILLNPAGGSVGIRTASPEGILDVHGANKSFITILHDMNAAGYTGGSGIGLEISDFNDVRRYGFFSDNSNSLILEDKTSGNTIRLVGSSGLLEATRFKPTNPGSIFFPAFQLDSTSGAEVGFYVPGGFGSNTIGFVTDRLERMRIDPSGKVGIGSTSPGAKLEVEVDDTEGVTGILIDNDDVTGKKAGLQIDMADGSGVPLLITPFSTQPSSTAKGSIYYDSDDDKLYLYNGAWTDLSSTSTTDHGGLGGLTDDDHTQYHNDTRGDARYFQETEHLAASAGAGSAGKPIKLDAAGHIDSTMINDADVDHGTVGGLSDDDHSQYLLMAGRAGGQVLTGGTAASDKLVLESTSHATKGDLLLNPAGGNVGIGNSSPSVALDVTGDMVVSGLLQASRGNTTTQGIVFDGSAPGDSGYIRYVNNSQLIVGVGNDPTDDLYLFSSGTISLAPSGATTLFVSNGYDVGIGTTLPGAKLEVEVGNSENVAGVIIDNNDINNDTPGLRINMAENGGAPLLINPLSTIPNTTTKGSIYYDSDDDKLYLYNGAWTDLSSTSTTDHGALGGLTDDDHTQYHNDTRGDARYFQETEHLAASAGAGDAGKPVKLDAAGHIDATMINDADVDHGTVGGLSDDDHSQYLLMAGRAGGQVLTGGTAAGDDLYLESTSNATKGDILLNAYGGKVGVGTKTPSVELEVNGKFMVGGSGSAAAPNISLNSDPNTGIFWSGADTLRFATNSLQRLEITGGGYVSTGSVQLAPNGVNSAGTPGYHFSGDTNTGIFRPAADMTAISTNGTERLRVDDAGNIGIGKTDPTGQKLWIVGGNGDQLALDNGGENYTALRFKNNGANRAEFQWYEPSNKFSIVNSQAGPLALYTNNTEQFTILSTGSVGIGITSPNALLNVDGLIQSGSNGTSGS